MVEDQRLPRDLPKIWLPVMCSTLVKKWIAEGFEDKRRLNKTIWQGTLERMTSTGPYACW